MVTKAEIIVEQFDNGITLRWRDLDDIVDPENVVTLEGQEERGIGNMIWSDIHQFFNEESTNKVKLKIEYLEAT